MPRPLKYLEGPVIPTALVAVSAILDGQYIIWRGKRLHPSFIGAWQLHQINLAARGKQLCFAIPNPEHPDHKEPAK